VNKFVQQLLGERNGHRSHRATGERCIGQKENGIDDAGTTADLTLGKPRSSFSMGGQAA
jgi:hypothetical protein